MERDRCINQDVGALSETEIERHFKKGGTQSEIVAQVRWSQRATGALSEMERHSEKCVVWGEMGRGTQPEGECREGTDNPGDHPLQGIDRE